MTPCPQRGAAGPPDVASESLAGVAAVIIPDGLERGEQFVVGGTASCAGALSVG